MDESHQYLAAAADAARTGAAALEDWRPRFRIREKGPCDLVTDADLAAQHAIRDHLLTRFPDHRFFAEEGSAASQPLTDPAPTWIVDPLDGTTNYVHDVPAYCVSVAIQVAGDILAGAIYDPRHDEMFTATCGGGAHLNGKPIAVSKTATLAESLLSCGFPANMNGQEAQLTWWAHFAFRAQALRRTGSTALNLAYVAAGRFEGFWAFDTKPWDVAAGVLLVREAGGEVSQVRASGYQITVPDILATNGQVHSAMCQQFAASAS